jgi:hypothetical protein
MHIINKFEYNNKFEWDVIHKVFFSFILFYEHFLVVKFSLKS